MASSGKFMRSGRKAIVPIVLFAIVLLCSVEFTQANFITDKWQSAKDKVGGWKKSISEASNTKKGLGVTAALGLAGLAVLGIKKLVDMKKQRNVELSRDEIDALDASQGLDGEKPGLFQRAKNTVAGLFRGSKNKGQEMDNETETPATTGDMNVDAPGTDEPLSTPNA